MWLFLNDKKYYIISFLIGGIIAYLLCAKTPDIKIIKEYKTVDRIQYKDRIINKDRIIERKIYVATNGTVITEEKEIIKDRIIEKEVLKEREVVKIETKEITYTAGVGFGINPFNLAEIAGKGEIKLIGSIWIEDIIIIDLKTFQPKTLIFISYKF